MFDKPQHWQALLQWLWDYGDKREIARSIPQLDPQTLRASVDENYSEVESGQMNSYGHTDSLVRDDDLSIRIAWKPFATGDIAGGLYESVVRYALVTFQIFKPSLRRSKPSPSHAGVGHQKWRIYFLVRSLIPILAAGNTAEHLLRSPHFAAFISSPVRLRVWLMSMHSATRTIHSK